MVRESFMPVLAEKLNSYLSPGRIGPGPIIPIGVLNTPCSDEAWWLIVSELTSPEGSPSSACDSTPLLADLCEHALRRPLRIEQSAQPRAKPGRLRAYDVS